MSILSTPILVALYNNARAQDTLALLSLAIVFVCTVSVSTAILQASGHVMIPVRNMLIGGAFKIVSNFILIAIPGLNIGGAPISTFFCYMLIAVLNLCSIRKIIQPKFAVKDFVIKPLASGLIMGAMVYFIYNLCAFLLGCPSVSLVVNFMADSAPATPVDAAIRLKTILSLGISIFCGVIAYVVACLTLKVFHKEDVEMLPKGKRIAIFLEKRNLL